VRDDCMLHRMEESAAAGAAAQAVVT
jgi:hypothetical protein